MRVIAMRLYGRRYPGWVWCWLTESNRRHPAYKAGALPAELNQQSGSEPLPAGVDVSCRTSLPKSPDRIAGIKKPKALTSGLNFLLRND